MPKRTLQQRLQRAIQVGWWKMDIHPSAHIATTALIDRTWPRGIHIGANCIISDEAVVLTHDLTRGLYLDTHIGDGSFLGARAIVLPGVTIGRDCVVHPGALVNRDMGDKCEAIGNPAVIKPLDD